MLSMLGWREHYVSGGDGLIAVDPETAPVSTAPGVLGMPGLTAYVGLREIATPESGETVFVSAAAGAVGSVAGQLARIGGCRVVGSAGSAEKVELLTARLLARRLTLRAFIVLDHYGLYREFAQEVGGHVRSGELSDRETVLDGIERMPAALLGLLEGANVGKMLVRVGPDPA